MAATTMISTSSRQGVFRRRGDSQQWVQVFNLHKKNDRGVSAG
jgi:hypothetical protein